MTKLPICRVKIAQLIRIFVKSRPNNLWSECVLILVTIRDTIGIYGTFLVVAVVTINKTTKKTIKVIKTALLNLCKNKCFFFHMMNFQPNYCPKWIYWGTSENLRFSTNSNFRQFLSNWFEYLHHLMYTSVLKFWNSEVHGMF